MNNANYNQENFKNNELDEEDFADLYRLYYSKFNLKEVLPLPE